MDNKNEFEKYKKYDIKNIKIGDVDTGIISYTLNDNGDFYIDEAGLKEIYPTEKIMDVKNKEKYQKYFEYDFDSLNNISFEDLEIEPAKIEDKNSIVKGKISVKKKENTTSNDTDNKTNGNPDIPREKEEWESYEKYEDYLKKFYDAKGINPGVAGKFDGVDVYYRGKYPHELSDENNEYYSNMLMHYNKKYSDMIKNASGQQKDDETKEKYIPGTKIPMPRSKSDSETFEEYEQYLHDYYKPYGLVDENIIYFAGTNIPIPRRPYPHEVDFLEKDSYYNQMLNYYSNKYKNQTSNEYGYTGQVEDGKQIAVVEQPKKEEEQPKSENSDSDILDDEVHEVKGIRKAFKWIKEHKKIIITAIGLASLVAAFVPGIAPAVMVANSKLWFYVPEALQTVLHGANSMLSMLCGAKEVEVGLWAIKGVMLNNATAMAHVSIIRALATSAAALAGSAAIVNTISYTIKNIKSKLQKIIKKNKKTEETNEPEKENNTQKENEKEINKTEGNDVQLTDDKEKISNIQKIKQKYNDIKESIKNHNQQPTVIEPKKEGDSKIIIEAGTPPMPQPEEYENESYYNKAINEWYTNYKDKITIEPYEEQMGGKSK